VRGDEGDGGVAQPTAVRDIERGEVRAGGQRLAQRGVGQRVELREAQQPRPAVRQPQQPRQRERAAA
jgi:hypothetical protein